MNRPNRFLSSTLSTLALALAFAGCAADDSADVGANAGSEFGPPAANPDTRAPGASGVSAAGAQDFGRFRQILEAGEVPHPDVLDPLGFLAEHKLDYPAPDCGDDVCLHALLGVGGNLMTGTNCTLLQIGLNSPLNPAELPRPPLDLVVAVDTSGSMRGTPILYVKEGLREMQTVLRAEDRLTIVAYDTVARIVAEDLAGDDRDAITAAIEQLRANGSTNLYDGLFTALARAEAARAPGREARVVFLSDGVGSAGLTHPARLQALADAYARRGIGITTIGLGHDFDLDTMRAISDTGAGNFYFLEDALAAAEVFTEEALTFLVPVALDVQIEVYAGMGYTVRGAYGTRGWTGGLRSGIIDQASLFLAGRQRAEEPVEGGRRGGGGGILVELMPRIGAEVADPDDVGRVRMRYTDPATGEAVEQTVDIRNPFAPGEIPLGGHYTHDTVRKGFVMLNILVGFQLAAELALEADYANAIALLDVLEAGVKGWLIDHPDPDIEDDLRYIGLFRDNLETVQSRLSVQSPPAPETVEPWPAD